MAKAVRARRHGGVVRRPTPAAAAAAGGSQAPTAFQSRVYELTKLVPEGKVSTYGEIAKALGSAPRAVGQASISPSPAWRHCLSLCPAGQYLT